MIRLNKDSTAICSVCHTTFRKCTCADIDERLKDLGESEYYVQRVCMNCGKHYARCNCEHPIWRRSDQSVPDPEMNELQRLDELEAAGGTPV